MNMNAVALFLLQKAFSALCHSTHLYGRRLVLEWADAEETVEALRRKTAEQFHGRSARNDSAAFFLNLCFSCILFFTSVASKKQRKAEVMEGILETMEMAENED